MHTATPATQPQRPRNACAAAEPPDAPRTTAPDHESGDAVPGSDGHVVDGQQRMRSTKQRPRPRRGRATTRRWPPPRPGPAERAQGHHGTSPTPRRPRDNGSRPRVGGSRPGRQRPRSGRATTDAEHQAKTLAPEGTCNDETVAAVTSRPRRTDPGPRHTSPSPRRRAPNRPRPRTSKADPAVTATGRTSDRPSRGRVVPRACPRRAGCLAVPEWGSHAQRGDPGLGSALRLPAPRRQRVGSAGCVVHTIGPVWVGGTSVAPLAAWCVGDAWPAGVSRARRRLGMGTSSRCRIIRT
ncbi:hypothetical protein ABIA38_004060 [Embleya sp. AB8]